MLPKVATSNQLVHGLHVLVYHITVYKLQTRLDIVEYSLYCQTVGLSLLLGCPPENKIYIESTGKAGFLVHVLQVGTW